jgi:hypothetical protein
MTRACSECPVTVDCVEKLHIASAASLALDAVQAPFLSGLLHFLRCKKHLGKFAEVLGGCNELKFVFRTARAA